MLKDIRKNPLMLTDVYKETLINVVEVFDEIKNTPSRNEKENILKDNMYFSEFRDMLEFLYNPYRLTGIKFKKLVKYATYTGDDVPQFNDVFEALEYIEKNNSGRDEDVKAIANFINQHDMETYGYRVHDFLQEFFTKDVKIGVTASTINKVYGKNTIPKFDVMLAKKYEDHEHKIKGEFGITLKIDGIRCIAIKENGSVKFFTRQGQPIEDLIELEEAYKPLPDNMVYDGELLLDNYDDSSDAGELFRATQKIVRKDGEKKGLNHILFDMLPVEEFKEGKSKKIYVDRHSDLSDLELEGNNRIHRLPLLYYGSDKNKIFEWLDKVVRENKEGVMVNIGNAHYETKRSDKLLKVKKMYTIDLRVVGYEEGTGKFKGMLGALVVEYKGNRVNVGSGFTDSDRKIIWTVRDDFIGRIIEVQYFEESENEDGKPSLRFPVFKHIRDDKTEESYH